MQIIRFEALTGARRLNPFAILVERRLNGFCARHERVAWRLKALPRQQFESASRCLRRVHHMRDLIRLRLFAARSSPLPRPSKVRRGLRTAWAQLLRESARLEAWLAKTGYADPPTRWHEAE